MIAPLLDLTGRTCIVTGAAQGIGAAEASILAERGATVLCVDRADSSSVVAAIRNEGGAAASWHGDITEMGAAEDIVATAGALGPPLAVLINNAGIVRDRMIFNLGDEDWDAVVAVNLTAPFRLCRAIARHWRAHGSGAPARVINTSSESGLYGNAGQSNYAAAKAGLAALTLTLAAELSRLGVCVNAIAPRARTAMSKAAFGERIDDTLAPRDVAQVVAWLASDLGDGITGQLLVVAGRDVHRLRTWSMHGSATAPGMWSAEGAAAFRRSLFPQGDTSHVPAPISDLFTARSVEAPS